MAATRRNDVDHQAAAPKTVRERLSPQDRRRQLIGIGLSMLVEHPIQELSIDAVAAQAGISRGLLFHYFPTKTAFYSEVTAAAARRVLRNVRPDHGVDSAEAVAQVARRYIAQIERRRESYIALVYGQIAEIGEPGSPSDTLRKSIADMLIALIGLDATTFDTVHGWIAYIEDRAIQWSGRTPKNRDTQIDDVVEDCVSALQALLGAKAGTTFTCTGAKAARRQRT